MDPTKVQEIEKVAAIMNEVEASFKFIATGLKLMKQQGYIVANNHVPLQSLASGFERLVKILLLIKDKYLTGDFAQHSKAKERFARYDKGHGIEKMLDELLEYSETIPLMNSTPMVRSDMDYLKNDRHFRLFLHIISEFSKYERYYYIDVIASKNYPKSQNVFQTFMNFLYSNTIEQDTSNLTHKQGEEAALQASIICIEKGARAISRFFTHGFGNVGTMYYKDFSRLILLDDKDLGVLDYTEKKVDISNCYQAKTVFSFLYLKISLLAKSKILHQNDYSNWPFKIKKAVVYNYKGQFYFVEVGNEIFSLTGKTSAFFKLPLYHESKHRKAKDYVNFLLEEAQKLKG